MDHRAENQRIIETPFVQQRKRLRSALSEPTKPQTDQQPSSLEEKDDKKVSFKIMSHSSVCEKKTEGGLVSSGVEPQSAVGATVMTGPTDRSASMSSALDLDGTAMIRHVQPR